MTELTIIEPDVAEAAEWIGAAWQAGVESIIETGRRLIETRHGVAFAVANVEAGINQGTKYSKTGW